LKAKESTKNSKTIELDELKIKSHGQINRRPYFYIRRMSFGTGNFKKRPSDEPTTLASVHPVT
jgi:hypothetical protein